MPRPSRSASQPEIRPLEAASQEVCLFPRLLLPLGLAVACWAQPPAAPSRLQLKVIAGQGAVNNIGMRVAAQPGVEVTDPNGAPVPGAEVIFQAPADGPGGSFFGGMRIFTVKTDSKGAATASGFIPNDQAGKFRIAVRASLGAAVAEGFVDQTNSQGPGSTSKQAMSSKQKKVWIAVAVVAAAAIGGGVAASGGDSTTAAAAAKKPVAIGAGPITVGGPR